MVTQIGIKRWLKIAFMIKVCLVILSRYVPIPDISNKKKKSKSMVSRGFNGLFYIRYMCEIAL